MAVADGSQCSVVDAWQDPSPRSNSLLHWCINWPSGVDTILLGNRVRHGMVIPHATFIRDCCGWTTVWCMTHCACRWEMESDRPTRPTWHRYVTPNTQEMSSQDSMSHMRSLNTHLYHHNSPDTHSRVPVPVPAAAAGPGSGQEDAYAVAPEQAASPSAIQHERVAASSPQLNLSPAPTRSKLKLLAGPKSLRSIKESLQLQASSGEAESSGSQPASSSFQRAVAIASLAPPGVIVIEGTVHHHLLRSIRPAAEVPTSTSGVNRVGGTAAVGGVGTGGVGPRLLFRGLRVRMGMASGFNDPSYVNFNKSAGESLVSDATWDLHIQGELAHTWLTHTTSLSTVCSK